MPRSPARSWARGLHGAEQAHGEIDRLDERCDVFALGSILCEVLTGQPAYTGRHLAEVQDPRAALGDTAEALALLAASGTDDDLIGLARDCLAPEAEDRPRDAAAVADQLAAHLSGVQDRLRAAELGRVAALGRARLTVTLAASVLTIALIGGGGWESVRRQRAAGQERTRARSMPHWLKPWCSGAARHVGTETRQGWTWPWPSSRGAVAVGPRGW